MNRRSFLSRLGTGAVAALALAHVPAAVIDAIGLHQLSADRIREQMRRIYNEHARGGIRNHPREIQMGREAFDTFEGQLLANERFIKYEQEPSGERTLMFKAATVRPVGAGWGMRIVA